MISMDLSRVWWCSWALLACPVVEAQGPGSAGFHLDVLGNLTSTHSAVADLPAAPGSGFAGLPPGVPGNPYTAYVTPGTSIKVRLSVAGSSLGPLPFGPGSVVTLFWSLGTPMIAIPAGPGFVPPAVPGQPFIVQVLPFGGAILDGLGVLGPPPIILPTDPGHPDKLEVSLTYPIGLPFFAPLALQALAMTPTGLFAISNAVTIIGGPNPAEISLLGGLVGCGGGAALDDGSVGIPLPPGFLFYGFPPGIASVSTNGYVELVPPAACDLSGSAADLGCAPATVTASPRVAVNHFDSDFSVPATPPRVADLTMEFAPPTPFTPSRVIVRWKNVANFGVPVGLLDQNRASMVVELWGSDGPSASRIAVVRQEVHSVTSIANHEMVGIGPGLPIHGFFGPPPLCTAIALPTLYGGPGYFGLPSEAIYHDNLAGPPLAGLSILSNLAVVFDPVGPFVPGSYVVNVY